MSFAVCVTFQVHQDHVDRFLPLIEANASASLRNEVGCLRFDVLTDPARRGEVFLYELYSDAAAFADHQATGHFKAFNEAAAGMIADKDIKTFAEIRS